MIGALKRAGAVVTPAVICMLLFWASSASAAGAVNIRRSPRTVDAGRAAAAWVRQPRRAGVFGDRVSPRARQGPFTYRVRHPLIRLQWRVPSRARSLLWSVSIRCAADSDSCGAVQRRSRESRVRGDRKGRPTC